MDRAGRDVVQLCLFTMVYGKYRLKSKFPLILMADDTLCLCEIQFQLDCQKCCD